MDITSPKDFPNRSLHTDLNSLYITALHYHFFLCWFEDFFPESSLAQLFTSVNGSLLLATQPVLFLKRLLSTGVVKRQHLHSTRCRVFFTLGSLLPAFHRICIKKLLLFFWRRPLWNMAINGLMFLEKKTYQWRYIVWLCFIFYL